jgi:FMN phosphatase YigB (HAD superfamily)
MCKIVVFDLDETLGHFVELGIFWDSLILFTKKEMSQQDFNNILDLYPEFLRPNIIEVLEYLKNKKKKNHCYKVMIYTNNQGPKSWAEHIVNYFHYKLNYELFDQIIAAFKINGKKVELKRTSHDKSYGDLLECTQLPSYAQICFLDDTFYPDMSHDNVYYINVKPFINDIPFETMVSRFWNNNKSLQEYNLEQTFKDFMVSNMKKYHYEVVGKTKEEEHVDKILTKKILDHLKDFFSLHRRQTKKNRVKKSGTLKLRKYSF